jgi:hypothetical protein
MPIWVCGIHPRDDVHPSQSPMVSIAHEELEVLEKLQCRLGIHVLLKNNVLLFSKRVPLLHLFHCEPCTFSDLLCHGYIEDDCPITIATCEFPLEQLYIT